MRYTNLFLVIYLLKGLWQRRAACRQFLADLRARIVIIIIIVIFIIVIVIIITITTTIIIIIIIVHCEFTFAGLQF